MNYHRDRWPSHLNPRKQKIAKPKASRKIIFSNDVADKQVNNNAVVTVNYGKQKFWKSVSQPTSNLVGQKKNKKIQETVK